jgi:predicted dehydrogenase
MADKEIRVGILGSGFAAAFHFEALRRVYSTKPVVVGVYSPTPEKRSAFADARGIQAFDSLEGLLDESEVVHVCTPPSSHEEITVAALEAGKSAIVEKPFTGYFGDGSPSFDGDSFPREEGLTRAMESVRRILQAEASGGGHILYAENWIYAPPVQKEREIIEKTEAQVIWMLGQESHSGSHSPFYGIWAHSGGGSIMGKSVHPLSTALYLKKVEGRMRRRKAIRPSRVSARTHVVTRSDFYIDAGYLKKGYKDIEDFGALHVVFDDGTFADIFASELVHGGVKNWIEVNANNHRTVCNINPNNTMETYNPEGKNFEDVYTVEKIGTKEGWSFTSPDEAWFHGYQHEMEAFYRSVVSGEAPEADSQLAADTIAVVYAAYLSAERGGQEVEVPQV